MIIGVLGGSFNPVHYGHISLARNVVASGRVDKVLLSLSPQSPFKTQDSLMDDLQRFKLLKEATKDVEEIEATDVELSLPKPSYTIQALHRLQALNPEDKYVLIIGADNLQRFTSWRDWDKILTEFGLIVYPRDEKVTILPKNLEVFRDKIVLLENVELFPISSTQIRNSATMK